MNTKILNYREDLISKNSKAITIANKLLEIVDPVLVPFRKGTKWGFSTIDKKIEIECIYDIVKPFDSRTASVCLNNSWINLNKKGVAVEINESNNDWDYTEDENSINHFEIMLLGEFLLYKNILNINYNKFTIENYSLFYDGLKIPDLVCFLHNDDINYNLENSCVFHFYEKNKYDFYLIRDDNWNSIRLEGKDDENRMIYCEGSSVYFYINYEGKVIIPPIYNDVSYYNGYFKVELNNKFGLINNSGEIVVSISYDSIDYFKNSKLACFEINGKYGLMIIESEFLIIPPTYDEVTCYKNDETFCFSNYFRVQIDNKYGIMNPEAKIIVPTSYDDVTCYGEYFRIKINNKYGMMNSEGKIVIDIIYQEFVFEATKKRCIVKFNNKWGVLDISNSTLIHFSYDNISCVKCNKNGLNFIVTRNGKYGIINNFRRSIVPVEYEYIEHIEGEDVFKVKLNNLWGCLSIVGNTLLPCKYEMINDFSQGLAIVSYNGKLGCVDMKGQIVSDNHPIFKIVDKSLEGRFKNIHFKFLINNQFKYEQIYIKRWVRALHLNKIFFAIEINGKIGFINHDGKTIVDFVFDVAEEVRRLGKGFGVANVKMDNKWGWFNDEGKLVVKTTYNRPLEFKKFDNGLMLSLILNDNNSAIGYVSSEGIEYWEN